MPTYLIHGFRWTRLNIRVHIIINDIEDAASEWIMAPTTSKALLQNFNEIYDFIPPLLSLPCQSKREPPELIDTQLMPLKWPNRDRRASYNRLPRLQIPPNISRSAQTTPSDIRPISTPTQRLSPGSESIIDFNDWSPVKLLEQYDPDDINVCSHPYAYVADYLVKVDLSVLIDEERQKYETLCATQTKHEDMPGIIGEEGINLQHESRPAWLERLRDELERDGHIGWFVVFCGDQERLIPDWARKNDSGNLDSQNPEDVSWKAGLKGIFKGKTLLPKSKIPMIWRSTET